MKNNNWHIYPVNDLKEHTTDSNDCECNPTLERTEDASGWLVIHHSYDGREYFEEDNPKFGKIN